MQIAEWLSKLDLGQYARCFAQNDIDVSVLRDLTDHDLNDLGVSLHCARARTGSQVTVMFCNLVGSTALATSMDPEDLGGVISAYQKCVAAP